MRGFFFRGKRGDSWERACGISTGFPRMAWDFCFQRWFTVTKAHWFLFMFALRSLPLEVSHGTLWYIMIYLSLSYTTWRSRALSSKSLHVFTTMSMYCLMSQRLRTLGFNARRHVACLNGYKTNCPQAVGHAGLTPPLWSKGVIFELQEVARSPRLWVRSLAHHTSAIRYANTSNAPLIKSSCSKDLEALP